MWQHNSLDGRYVTTVRLQKWETRTNAIVFGGNVNLIDRHTRRCAQRMHSVLGFCLALGFSLAIAPDAKAAFMGYYDVNGGNWTLMNAGDPSTDGSAVTNDSGLSVVITGGNSGIAIGGGSTTFLIAAPAAGTVTFDWMYTSLDSNTPACVPPNFNTICDSASYTVGSTSTFLADDTSLSAPGQSVSGTGVTFSVTSGQIFGFEVDTADNQGGPGVLTISNFSAPPSVTAVPEPGTAFLLFIGISLTAGAHGWKKRSRK
jgi:hypothetical protein